MNTAWFSGKPIRAWRRLMAANGIATTLLCGLFLAALVAGVIYGRDLASLGGGKSLAGSGGGMASGGRGLSVDLDAGDPVARFAETRVGHIVYSPTIDERCRRVLFDNRTGYSGEAGSVVCQRLAPEAESMPADRLQTLSKTFKR